MHELSVCLALLDEVDRVAREAGADRVRSVTLRIGPLSGVDPGLLARAFDVASIGTVADGAELRIFKTPVRIRCARCGGEEDASANRLLCPRCGSDRTSVVEGDEMVLSEMEMDVPADGARPVAMSEAGLGMGSSGGG